MAMKLKPMRRSLVTHERIIKPSEKAIEFIYDLFEGKLDDDIQQILDRVPSEVVQKYPPIQTLVDTLKSRITGNTEEDLITVNKYLNANDAHPHSIKLLFEVSKGLDGLLSQETIDAFKEGILLNFDKSHKHTHP